MNPITIKHFPNDLARQELSKISIFDLSQTPSDNLLRWMEKVSYNEGYLLSDISDRNVQIITMRNFSNEFDTEMILNKINLEDDYEKGLSRSKYIGIYFSLCEYLLSLTIKFNLPAQIISRYSTDSYNDDEEFPSHTVSFGLQRSEDNLYVLDNYRYSNVLRIASIIG
ncbi:hypothetical protein SAMN04487976_1451 [Xaviernesmea oryzae]|nr:hypothetical protein SAMN04487976_1451 [Xaviernesmea oryzae]